MRSNSDKDGKIRQTVKRYMIDNFDTLTNFVNESKSLRHSLERFYFPQFGTETLNVLSSVIMIVDCQ